MRKIALFMAAALVLGQTACTSPATVSQVVPTPSIASMSPSLPASSTPATTPSASPSPTFIDEIVLAEPSTIAPNWSLLFELPYGDAPDRLGTSLGGDGEGIRWGPEYGTQLPDGTWWFLDAAHMRLAQFGDDGTYRSEVKLPKKFLAQGQYFQWASPQALADGTLVLVSTSLSGASLLLMAPDRTLSRVPMKEQVGLLITDGRYLYGFDHSQRTIRVDPRNGAITRVKAFAGQSGDTFALAVGDHDLRITRGMSSRTVPVHAAGLKNLDIHPWIQAAAAADGTLAVFISGMVEETVGNARDVAGFVTVDRQGRVSPVESVPDPFSDSDPGGGSHVGVRLGDSRPWLMFVDTDALRVYRRG